MILMHIKTIGMKGYHEYKNCIDACLRCAAICNHCASSCTQEEDVKMMARCIQLDMECAAICYAAAQLMSLGSDKSLVFALKYARHVVRSVVGITHNIARNVPMPAGNVRKSAETWLHDQCASH